MREPTWRPLKTIGERYGQIQVEAGPLWSQLATVFICHGNQSSSSDLLHSGSFLHPQLHPQGPHSGYSCGTPYVRRPSSAIPSQCPPCFIAFANVKLRFILRDRVFAGDVHVEQDGAAFAPAIDEPCRSASQSCAIKRLFNSTEMLSETAPVLGYLTHLFSGFPGAQLTAVS
jgi:hypothetical protein